MNDRQYIRKGDRVRLALKGAARDQQMGAAHTDQGTVVRTDYENKDLRICVRRDGVKSLKWYPLGVWELFDTNQAETDTNAQLLDDCRLHIKDSGPKLVYADYLTEHGEPFRAAAWRYLGKNNLYPEFRTGDHVQKRWRFWSVELAPSPDLQSWDTTPSHALLPQALFVAAYGAQPWVIFRELDNGSDNSAMGGLAAGFAKLKAITDQVF